ncbi:MAG: hypothetical protein CMI27_00455 [Opitutae bacterium]|nr:hypothetical protein [Opitutae bacterium]|tara:strand:- start:26372 stop:27790 length:1419 start_codon:yes stop_codon:yes gene_type:complete
MSNPTSKKNPKSFGEKFMSEGLTGILRRKKTLDSSRNPNEMHFLEHLEELRWVILKAILVFIAGCLGVAIFLQDSAKVLQVPLIKAVEDFGEIQVDLQSIGMDQYIQPLVEKNIDLSKLRKAKESDLLKWGISDPHHQTRILTHFSDGRNRNLLQVIRSFSPIFIAMKICFLGGLGISLPLILYFIGSFVVPGLTPQEKRIFFPGCVAATFLFLSGASMTYFLILPYSLAFTIEFSFNILGLEVYRPEAGNYYSMVIWMTFAVGVAFQFPLVLILMIRIGVLSTSQLRKNRRIVLVVIMVVAAFITPGGDPVSLSILSIPLYFLYELAIFAGAFVEKNKALREWNEWDVSIQGPRPQKPKKNNHSVFAYIVILSAISIAGIFYIVYSNQINQWSSNTFQFFFSEPVKPVSSKPKTISVQSIKTKTEQKSDLRVFSFEEEFMLELTPIGSDLNGSKINELNRTQTFLAVPRKK